jgi:hypothetical protein
MNAGDRSTQGKTAARSPATMVYFIGHNHTDHTVTLSVNGKRHEFWLTPSQCNTVEFLCKRASALKALNYAKQRNRSPVGTPVGAITG